MKRVDLEATFWERVRKDGPRDPELGNCWFWTAGDGRIRNMSQKAWELAHGKAVPGSKRIAHWCSHTSCCNPEHLYTGRRLKVEQAGIDKVAEPLGCTDDLGSEGAEDPSDELACGGALNFSEHGELIDHEAATAYDPTAYDTAYSEDGNLQYSDQHTGSAAGSDLPWDSWNTWNEGTQ